MSKKPITVVVSGKMRSGKDTVKDILVKEYKDFKHLALANEVKRITAEIMGVSVAYLEEHKFKFRPNIVYTGDVGRALDPETWVKRLPHDALFHSNSVITDVRFKNEFFYFNSLKKTNNVIKVRVKASDEVRIARGADPNLFTHPSEADLDDVDDDQFDLVLENNGAYQDFHEKVLEYFKNKIN